jgi:hypothetical protein
VLDALRPVLDEFAEKPGFAQAVGFTAEWAERRADFAGRGFSEAELDRTAKWYATVLLLKAEREAEHRRLNTPGWTPDPGEESASRQRIAGYEAAASEGAHWLGCRMQHGPGVCEADCKGEFRHRPQWQPAGLGTSPDDLRQAALIAQTGRAGAVSEVTSAADELVERMDDRRDVFASRYFPYGGWDEQQTRAN